MQLNFALRNENEKNGIEKNPMASDTTTVVRKRDVSLSFSQHGMWHEARRECECECKTENALCIRKRLVLRMRSVRHKMIDMRKLQCRCRLHEWIKSKIPWARRRSFILIYEFVLVQVSRSFTGHILSQFGLHCFSLDSRQIYIYIYTYT